MRSKFQRLTRELRTQTSGNATLMVALGVPILIGSTGLAVDTAQWYLWKRELQYAVDQAVIAAAFARDDSDTENYYVTRARQEYAANLSLTAAIATPANQLTPTLEDYDGGTDNSVRITATASGKLPFSSFLTGNAVTVRATALAAFGQGGAGYTACLVALDQHDDKAIWFNGGPDVNAGCGVVALSDSSKAIEVSGGSGTLDLGWVVAAGGVDDYFDNINGVEVVENQQNLYDPYSSVSAPDNPTPRTLDCQSTGATYTATYDVYVTVDEKYYEGGNKNSLTLVSTTQLSANHYTQTGTVDASAQVGDTQTTPDSNTINSGSNGSGKNKVYYRTDHDTTTVTTITSIAASGGSSGHLQPGTYDDFSVSGNCVMDPGVYVINGGTLDAQGGTLTGNGVMFVLRNGAGIKINGNANINITAMSEDQMIAAGISSSDAAALKDMLIIEDRSSSGNSNNKINGTSDTYLNGTIYLPKSGITFLGTAQVTSKCLMIAAKSIQIGGTADMATFCPPNMQHTQEFSESSRSVKLIG